MVADAGGELAVRDLAGTDFSDARFSVVSFLLVVVLFAAVLAELFFVTAGAGGAEVTISKILMAKSQDVLAGGGSRSWAS